MAVEVVVEGLEWTLAQAPTVRLHPKRLAVRPCPVRHFPEVGEIAVVFARDVEGVEELHHALKAYGAVDAEVDAPPYLHRREVAAQDYGHEWRGRGDGVGEESGGPHFVEVADDEVGKGGRNGVVAVAVAVEEGVELYAVGAGPGKVGNQAFAYAFLGVVWRGAAG